ncbi:hypothetical protein FK004_12625 [Flavobacterium kingsejongi]|uniref:Uncharacterized protein n=1 Tax=Flavobacterium kingsejongi TaxID=1678728 RepID=A0A2S1LQI2_9FLAO|nr:hypothetical protein FK004_12625 [Flavobacterium kingsejongi]
MKNQVDHQPDKEQMFTTKQLVAFGNFLLSRERKRSFQDPSNKDKVRKECNYVNDTDLANWKNKVS